MADVGDGTTFTMTGFSGDIISTDSADVAFASVGTFHLGTTGGKTYISGDTYDPGTITLVLIHDPDTQPPLTGVTATGTITYPIPSGGLTGATHASDCHVESWSPGNAAVDELMQSTLVLKRSGDLTFVAST